MNESGVQHVPLQFENPCIIIICMFQSSSRSRPTQIRRQVRFKCGELAVEFNDDIQTTLSRFSAR